MSQQTGPVTITGYEQKSGTGKNGKPYLMHKFKASDGNEYTTFDAGTAQKAQQAGSSPVVLEYETRQNGQYVNYTLNGVQQAGGVPPQVQASTVQVARLDTDAKITRLAAQRSAAQLIGNITFLDQDKSIGTYRKLVEELILHAETGRWATSQPVQAPQENDLPWPEQAA